MIRLTPEILPLIRRYKIVGTDLIKANYHILLIRAVKSTLAMVLVCALIQPTSAASNNLLIEGQTNQYTDEAITKTTALRNPVIDFIFPTQLEAKIGRIPTVESTHVSRSGFIQLTIQIQEYKPVAYWQTGTKRVAIGSSGQIMEYFVPNDNPTIIEFSPDNPSTVTPNHDALYAVQILQNQSPEMTLLLADTTLLFIKEKGLIVRLSNGNQVILGDSSNLEEKLQLWEMVHHEISKPAQSKPIELDLRFKNKALVRGITTIDTSGLEIAAR
ncbi:MAG: cell division protein FtsQ/DivIB [Chloroflexota bacterium]|nr:cell division protein FtsQ/DivIB [Chloroflexota bacterium]